MSSSSARHLVQKTTARVFSHGKNGGNPVTVFASDSPLPPERQRQLAESCEWESVMVHGSEFSFFLPSGEKVAFCAHAAIGGARATGQTDIRNATGGFYSVALDQGDGDEACLRMTTPWKETKPSQLPLLARIARQHLGVSSLSEGPSDKFPTFVHSHIAGRPKTLLYVEDISELHPPSTDPVFPNSDATFFSQACDALDETTGVYAYMQVGPADDATYECRQFPRLSGYGEDPATGVAAAALAASIYNRMRMMDVYRIHQGEQMGRPSFIQVKDMKVDWNAGTATFGLQGRVEVDDEEEIQVDD